MYIYLSKSLNRTFNLPYNVVYGLNIRGKTAKPAPRAISLGSGPHYIKRDNMTDEATKTNEIDPITAMSIEIDNLKKQRADDRIALDKATAQMSAVVNTNKNLVAEIGALKEREYIPDSSNDKTDNSGGISSYKKYLKER